MKRNNRFSIYSLSLMLFLLTFFNNCKNDDPPPPVPILTTLDVSSIEKYSAKCGIDITSNGGSKITNQGVCWSKGTIPTINDNKMGCGSLYVIGKSSCTINGLKAITKYYVRAFATNSAGTGYGNIISFKTTGALIDCDGNVYDSIRIGTQVWLKQNLKVSHYRNGDPIPNVKDVSTWISLSTGAFCYYYNDSIFNYNNGKLYNWYAVNDSRNIAPFGWHVATNEEWITLIDYLGGASVAGGKIKGYFDKYNFGGWRVSDGVFMDIDNRGFWWNTAGGDPNSTWGQYILNSYNSISRNPGYDKIMGFSVLCVKDL